MFDLIQSNQSVKTMTTSPSILPNVPSSSSTSTSTSASTLTIDNLLQWKFKRPERAIYTEIDLKAFQASSTYHSLLLFIRTLNEAVKGVPSNFSLENGDSCGSGTGEHEVE